MQLLAGNKLMRYSASMSAKPQRKLTQDERSALSNQRLIDAAVRLIVKVGSAGTTLQALGETSGYSRGQVTYRFGTKAGLFKAVIKQVSERWSRSLEARVDGLTGASALLACSDAYFEFVHECPHDICAMNILSQQACEPDSQLREIVCRMKERQTRQLRSWVLQGQADGSIRAALDADACAAHFVAYHSGVTYLWMLDGGFDWERVQTYARLRLTQELEIDHDR